MRDDDSIYYDTYNEGPDEEEKPTGAKKIIKNIFRVFFFTILFCIIAILCFRFISIKEPKSVKGYIFTESILESFENSPTYHGAFSNKYPSGEYTLVERKLGFVKLKSNQTGEEFTIKPSEYEEQGFTVYTQTLYNYTVTDSESGESQVVKRDEYYADPNPDKDSIYDGCYRVTNQYFTPSASSAQVTFRYNGRSGIAKLMHDYSLSSEPKGEVFVFTLSDNLGNEYTEYSYQSKTKSYYHYRTLVFENVNYDDVSTLTLNIYYTGDVKLGEPFVSMVIYDENLVMSQSEVKLTPKLTANLLARPKYSLK